MHIYIHQYGAKRNGTDNINGYWKWNAKLMPLSGIEPWTYIIPSALDHSATATMTEYLKVTLYARHTMRQTGKDTRGRADVFVAGSHRANFKSTSLINANSNPKSGCISSISGPDYTICRWNLSSTYRQSAGFSPYVRRRRRRRMGIYVAPEKFR